MYTFLISILCLFLGGAIYSRVIERVFGVDDKRKTPAYTMQDGVDFIPMPTWKLFLIQFLNISDTAPTRITRRSSNMSIVIRADLPSSSPIISDKFLPLPLIDMAPAK